VTAPRTDSGLLVVPVDRVDPLVLACATCDETLAGCWPGDSASKLLWAVTDGWDAHRQEAGG
jgi:hypothetical protein